MADESAPAPAEEQATVPASKASKAKAPDPAPAPEPFDDRPQRFADAIRRGVANSALSRDAQAMAALETRLPEIVAAILKEV